MFKTTDGCEVKAIYKEFHVLPDSKAKIFKKANGKQYGIWEYTYNVDPRGEKPSKKKEG